MLGEPLVLKRGPHKSKTHCHAGHEMTAANTKRTTAGSRRCRACEKEYMRRWAIRRPRRDYRRMSLMKSYGLTSEQYDVMHAAQSGLCASCHRPETSVFKGKVKRLAVDHDHTTGAVRGLLCAKCNVAVGMLDDSVENALALVAYIQGFKSERELEKAS